MKKTQLALTLLMTLGLAACSASPTGRNQLLLFSDNDMSQLGAKSFTQMKQEIPISKDAKTNAYVQCVTKAIIAQVPSKAVLSNGKWSCLRVTKLTRLPCRVGKLGYTRVY